MFTNTRCLHQIHRLCRSYRSDSKNYAQQPQIIAKTQPSKNRPEWIEFAKPKHGTFFQQPPHLRNPWTTDVFANKLIQTYLPAEVIVDSVHQY